MEYQNIQNLLSILRINETQSTDEEDNYWSELCEYCEEEGHCKEECPSYLEEKEDLYDYYERKIHSSYPEESEEECDYCEGKGHGVEECPSYLEKDDEDEDDDYWPESYFWEHSLKLCEYCSKGSHNVWDCPELEANPYLESNTFSIDLEVDNFGFSNQVASRVDFFRDFKEDDFDFDLNGKEFSFDVKGNNSSTEEEEKEYHFKRKFCEVCDKEGHLWKECPESQNNVSRGKKSRQRARRKEKNLLSNHIDKVDWETIGRVN